MDNSNGKFCNTYPSLVVIPNNVSFPTLQGCVQFRSKNRFPIMTYYYKDENVESGLWRSSQINVKIERKKKKNITKLKPKFIVTINNRIQTVFYVLLYAFLKISEIIFFRSSKSTRIFFHF